MSTVEQTDLLELLPLRRETPDTVRARFDASVNAGVSPADAAYVDTTAGSIYWDVTQTVLLEFVRIYEVVTVEMVAASLVWYAWGTYLDLHGQGAGVPRKAAVASSGEVTFIGDPGVLVAAGTKVSTRSADPTADPITFETTEGRYLAALPAPTNFTALSSGSGALVAGDYFYTVTAEVEDGETLGADEEEVTVAASSSVSLHWAAVDGASGYVIYRGTRSGRERLIDTTTHLFYDDDGEATQQAAQPPTNTIAVAAVTPGRAGNVAAGAIELVLNPPQGVAAVANAEPLSGGADVESDELYRKRILKRKTQPRGGGNITDYEAWCLDYPPVGYVTVEPVWDGPGTVRVTVTDQDNNPVSATVVDGLQDELDPIPEQGHGKAPIGHTVTVETPALKAIVVSATGMEFDDGYSLDGDNGTTPLRSDIEQSLSEYIDALPPGADVVYNRVVSAILNVAGVYDVGTLTLNGAGTDVTVAALEVAAMTFPPTLGA